MEATTAPPAEMETGRGGGTRDTSDAAIPGNTAACRDGEQEMRRYRAHRPSGVNAESMALAAVYWDRT
jgi:hypothetical protein